MALKKITTADIGSKGVQAIQGNTLVGNADENKRVFDRLVTDVVADVVNGMVDGLASPAGTAEIGFSAEALKGLPELDAGSLGAVLLESVKSVELDKATKNVTVTLHNGESETMNFISPGGEAVASKSKTIETVLRTDGWSGPEYSLAVEGVTANSYQELLPAIGITEEQLAALQKANLQDAGQANGMMYLFAYGETPTIEIPVRVVLRGD